jgi:hypothetical protein
MDLDGAYAELGLQRGATPSEVRSAYRRECLRRHPDKRPRHQEPTDAAADFAALHQAYRVAADDAEAGSRKTSVAPLNVAQLARACVAFLMAALLRYRAADDVGGGGGGGPQAVLEVDISVSLDDVFHARVKKVVLSVLRFDGPRRAPASQVLFVPLRAYADSYEFRETGDELAPGVRGSVRVNLTVTPHPVYSVDSVCCRHDLHASVDVDPFEYYYGKQVILPHFSGLSLDVSHPGFATHEDTRRLWRVRVFHRHGLPYFDADGEHARGDLYVFFDLKLPDLGPDHLLDAGVRAAFRTAFGRRLDPPAVDPDSWAPADS